MNSVRLIDGALICPSCGGSNLHHKEVRVMFRDQEDGEGTLVASSHKGTTITRLDNASIPGRRDVVDLVFTCEQCLDKQFMLEIRQHKGATEFSWHLEAGS